MIDFDISYFWNLNIGHLQRYLIAIVDLSFLHNYLIIQNSLYANVYYLQRMISSLIV